MPESIGGLAVVADDKGRLWYRLADPSRDDDPRWVAWVPVRDLVIDTSVQRDLKPGTLNAISRAGWRWDRAEALTVARRDDGSLAVVEGQHRTEHLRQASDSTRILCILGYGISGPEGEAGVALGISSSRTPHSMYDKWEGRLVAGDPHVTAADAVLSVRSLRIGHGRTSMAVSAPSAVMRIIYGTVTRPRTPGEGADLLGRTLDAAASIPVSADGADRAGARWDASILTAVANVIDDAGMAGKTLRAERLAAALGRHDVSSWLAFARRTTPRWRGIADEIRAGYNHGLHGTSRI